MSDLPVEEGRLHRYSDAAYSELVAALSESAKAIAAGADELAEGLFALRSVMTFLSYDPALVGSDINTPLATIHWALHDLQCGGRPAILFDRKKADNAPAKPMRTSRDKARGVLAGALDVLITHGQIRRNDAAKWLENELQRAAIFDTAGQPIGARRLLRWREEASAGSGPSDSTALFEYLRRRNVAFRKLSPLAGTDFAKERALAIVQILSVQLPSAAPGEQTHSRGS